MKKLRHSLACHHAEVSFTLVTGAGIFKRVIEFGVKQRLRFAALGFWALVLVGWLIWSSRSGLTSLAAVQILIDLARGSVWGPILYIGAYALRPFLFFPATLLSIAGGYVFGPVWGLAYTLIAANASAVVAYLTGRWFGSSLIPDVGPLTPYTGRLRRNGFETVLILRLLLAPYDLVGFVSGLLAVPPGGFLLATALGILPGSLAFVSFGAAIQGGFIGATPTLDAGTLIFATIVLSIGIAVSRWLRAREKERSSDNATLLTPES